MVLGLAAEPFQEGVREDLDPAKTFDSVNESSQDFAFEIERQETDFLILRFDDISNPLTESFELVIRDKNYREIDRICSDEFSEESEYWTALLDSGYALVQINSNENLKALSFTIRSVIRSQDGAHVLSITLPDDRKHAAEYMGSTELMAAARSVGKLVFLDGLELKSCTGFLISEDHFVTNAHCVSDHFTCRTTTVIFGYQLESKANGSWRTIRGERYRCASAAPQPNVDLSVLTLRGQPGSKSKWGYLEYSTDPPLAGEALVLVHHPGGQPKQITRDNCKILGIKEVGPDQWLNHRCDTLSGSSGSPVLDSQYNVVGVHTLGFGFRDGEYRKENVAIRWHGF